MWRKYSKKNKKSHTRRRSTRTRRRSTRTRLRKQQGGRPKLYAQNAANVIELSSIDFEKDAIKNMITKRRPGIVMMYADWCPHCNNEETIKAWKKLSTLVDQKNGYVAAMNCADEQNTELAKRLGIKAYPTVLFVAPEGTLYKTGDVAEQD